MVSSSSLSEWHACARVRESGTQRQKGNIGGTKHGSLAYGNTNGEGADGRLGIARVGIEYGTNAQDGESEDSEIGTVALRQERTQHGSLAYANKNGERGDGSLEIARVGIEHGPKGQDGKSDGTHGWKYRSSRMRCLF